MADAPSGTLFLTGANFNSILVQGKAAVTVMTIVCKRRYMEDGERRVDRMGNESVAGQFDDPVELPFLAPSLTPTLHSKARDARLPPLFKSGETLGSSMNEHSCEGQHQQLNLHHPYTMHPRQERWPYGAPVIVFRPVCLNNVEASPLLQGPSSVTPDTIESFPFPVTQSSTSDMIGKLEQFTRLPFIPPNFLQIQPPLRVCMRMPRSYSLPLQSSGVPSVNILPQPGSGENPGNSSPTLVNEDINKEFGVGDDELTNYDVLLGRGGMTNSHLGNIYFRALVDEYRLQYATAKKGLKRNVAVKVLSAVRANHGRFLKNDVGTDLWYEVGDAKAIEKTGQTLREGVAAMVRETLEAKPRDQEGNASPLENCDGSSSKKQTIASRRKRRKMP